MSRITLALGSTVRGMPRLCLTPFVESLLECARPATMTSRLAAVFSVPARAFSRLGLEAGHVYRVKLLGHHSRHDAHWLGLLQGVERAVSRAKADGARIEPKLVEHARSHCANYWTGEASEDPVWEFVGPEVSPIQYLGYETIPANQSWDLEKLWDALPE